MSSLLVWPIWLQPTALATGLSAAPFLKSTGSPSLFAALHERRAITAEGKELGGRGRPRASLKGEARRERTEDTRGLYVKAQAQ